MNHLTDEEMIEQAYGESGDPPAVQQHLASCRACAANFAELRRDLGGLDRVSVPSRDPGYGQHVWNSIESSLPLYRLAAPTLAWQRWWSTWYARGLVYAAACALLVSCAFYAGRQWEQRKLPTVAKTSPHTAPKAPQPIVVVVLGDHLDRSERFLVELKHADLDPASMASPMRDEARSLLAANRVCRKNVADAKDPELTTALDHLDTLLAEAANAPGGLNTSSIAKLQDEMNSDGLLFEVRVLRSRIRHPKPPAGPKSAQGGTI